MKVSGGRRNAMLGLGIHTREQYDRMGASRRLAGPEVAYNLLKVGDHPSPEDIRAFEDLSVTLRTSNGTFRTTFRNRFEDVDIVCLRLMSQSFPSEFAIRIEDRAVSHGLTSCEWAKRLLPVFPAATIEASDLMLQLLELSLERGEIFITELDGTPLQYIKPPFVVSVLHAESWRNPMRRLIAVHAKKRFSRLSLPKDWMEKPHGSGYRVVPIPYIHPEAAALARTDSRFRFCRRSVFERTPQACHAIRTMNIFNRSYFSADRLAEGYRAIFDSLQPGGIWIVGRTLEADLSNHATLFRRREHDWEVLDRVGGGWEMEQMALDLFR
jgi:hypothetical protein